MINVIAIGGFLIFIYILVYAIANKKIYKHEIKVQFENGNISILPIPEELIKKFHKKFGKEIVIKEEEFNNFISLNYKGWKQIEFFRKIRESQIKLLAAHSSSFNNIYQDNIPLEKNIIVDNVFFTQEQAKKFSIMNLEDRKKYLENNKIK